MENKNEYYDQVIVFDCETNGLDPLDKIYGNLLSLSALKLKINIENPSFEVLDKYDRYYFPPSGRYNEIAVKINGLNKETIEDLRLKQFFNGTMFYPYHYENDIEGFKKFCEGVDHFVAHNISFDRRWVGVPLKYEFCTMINTINEVAIKITMKNGYVKNKFPKLIESASYLGIETEKDEMHQSKEDTYICAKVFVELLKRDLTKSKVINFLKKENLTASLPPAAVEPNW